MPETKTQSELDLLKNLKDMCNELETHSPNNVLCDMLLRRLNIARVQVGNIAAESKGIAPRFAVGDRVRVTSGRGPRGTRGRKLHGVSVDTWAEEDWSANVTGRCYMDFKMHDRQSTGEWYISLQGKLPDTYFPESDFSPA